MGNSSSSIKNPDDKNFNNMYNVIDFIATNYILTTDFKGWSQLTKKEYCDKLLILTSDIIDRKFNNVEIAYLAQRLEKGEEINRMTKDKITYVNKDGLGVNDDSIQKKRMCVGIAKFYIKIAHVFASIVMTINPVYVYKDEFGNTVKRGLLEKDKIPKNTIRKIFKLNICDKRIRALKHGEVYDEQTGDVTLQPKICDLNLNGEKTLEEEPGILELKQLYFDDKYDYSLGTFHDMSDATRKNIYEKDVATFYKAFTGDDTVPLEINEFSKIKLRDYSKTKLCENPKITVSKNDKLFIQYADNIRHMIANAAKKQSELLAIINEMFAYIVDPKTGTRQIRINPSLTEQSLDDIVIRTRKIIIDLYVNCEKDYLTGIKLYEAIVEMLMLKTTENRIQNLQDEAKNLSDGLLRPPKNKRDMEPPLEEPPLEEQPQEEPPLEEQTKEYYQY